MEYPDNPLDSIGADGAFQIGDGFKFGQDFTEGLIQSMFRVPAPTPEGAIELLREYLLKLPLEVLQAFKDLIPDALESQFVDVVTAVTTIISSLVDRPWDAILKALKLICEFLTDNPLAQCIAALVEDTGNFAENFVRGAFVILEGLSWFLTNNILVNSFKDLVNSSGVLLLDVVAGAVEALQRLMNLLGFANPAAALNFFDNAVTELWELLSGAVSNGAKTLQDIFGVLTSWIESVPLLKPLIQAITGLASITTLEGLGEWIRKNLLSVTSKIPALNLIGQIPATVMGVLNVGHLTNQPVNLLLQPSFQDALTISPVDGWSWDGSQNASGTGGSAKVVCDGFNKELSHQTAVLVAPGDAMSLSAKVKTSAVTGSGWKAGITLMEYRNGAIATPVEIASRTSNTSSWVEIAGSYVVPAGVSSVVFRLFVENATSGTVWFDDMDFHKSGSIAQDWVGNLTDTWETIYTGVTGGDGTGKRWDDMAPVLGTVSSTANTAQTNAGTANTNIFDTWNKFWEGVFGGTATGKNVFDLKSAAGTVRSTANTGVANAATAQATANTASSSASSAVSTATSASGRLDTTNSRLFGTTNPSTSSKVQQAALPLETILPTAGSGCQISRRSTVNVNLGGGRSLLPAGFFDTVDIASPDITVTNGHALSVTHTGWYQVELSMRLNPDMALAWALAPLLYKGSSYGGLYPYKIGADANAVWLAGAYYAPRYAQASWIVYMPAGHCVGAGVDGAGAAANLFDADASGVETYFSISLLNKSFA